MATTIIDYTLVPQFSALKAIESSAQLMEVFNICSAPTPKVGFLSKNDFSISLPDSQTQAIKFVPLLDQLCRNFSMQSLTMHTLAAFGR